MLFRTGQFACVIAFFAICGGHWAVLQTVAWATMIRDYSADSGIVLAVQQALSGDRPCGMCVRITKARQEEKQSPAAINLTKKWDLALTAGDPAIALRVSHERDYPPDLIFSFSVRNQEPAHPVPRLA